MCSCPAGRPSSTPTSTPSSPRLSSATIHGFEDACKDLGCEFTTTAPATAEATSQIPTIKEQNPYFFPMGAYDCQWFVLEKVQSLLDQNQTLPAFKLNAWENLLRQRETLETSVLPAYLMRMRWFGGKGRVQESMKIIHVAIVPQPVYPTYLLLIEWDSVEAHTVGFRESENYTRWRELISPFFDGAPRVEHFTEINITNPAGA